MFIEKRKYARIAFDKPLCSKMTIEKISNEEINLGYAHVCIKNISPGGLCFVSKLNIPVNRNILLKFEISVKNHIIMLSGNIVRNLKMQKGIYEYGIEFVMNEDIHTAFIIYLIDLAKKVKENAYTADVCNINIDECAFNNTCKG